MSLIQSVLQFFGFSDHDDESVSKPSAEVIHHVSPERPTIQAFPESKMIPSEIRIANPSVYEDSVTIASHLQKKRAVLVNLQQLSPSTAKRMIDFLCGTAYAMNGHMKKVSDYLFIFSPSHILIEMADDISDIEHAYNEHDRYKLDQFSGT
jgi:cell division inhibitor SepF